MRRREFGVRCAGCGTIMRADEIASRQQVDDPPGGHRIEYRCGSCAQDGDPRERADAIASEVTA